MPPVEFAVQGAALPRASRDETSAKVGRGVLQLGPRNGNWAGMPSYLVRMSDEALLLQPAKGTIAPWYVIPRDQLTTVPSRDEFVRIGIVGHRPIEFATYEGAELTTLISGEQSILDAEREATASQVKQRGQPGPLQGEIRRAQVVLLLVFVFAALALAVTARWAEFVGVVVGAYLGVGVVGRLLRKARPPALEPGAGRSIRGMRVAVVVRLTPVVIFALVLLAFGGSSAGVAFLGAMMLSGATSVWVLTFAGASAIESRTAEAFHTP